MLTTSPSLAAPKVVAMTTIGAASDEKVVNMTTFLFQGTATSISRLNAASVV